MQRPLLNDPNTFPDDKVLSTHLASAKSSWDEFLKLVASNSELETEWRYYPDGKSWLFKVKRKSKVLCWVSIWEHSFKTTFYFSRRLAEAVKNSSIAEIDKQQYSSNTKPTNFKAITVVVETAAEIQRVKELLRLKTELSFSH